MSNATETSPWPSLAEISPGWKRLSDRVHALSVREEEIYAEMRAIDFQRSKRDALDFRTYADPGYGRPDIPWPVRPPAPISDDAMALLGDLAPPPAEPAPVEKPQLRYRDEFGARCAALGQELTAIREALRVLHPQLAKAHQTASRDYCAAVRPAYDDVAGRLCRAMIDLGAAWQAHDTFTRGLKAEGVDGVYLRPIDAGMVAGFIGNPQDRNDPLRRFLSWAAEQNHFNLADIPEEWTMPATGGGAARSQPQAAPRATTGAPDAAQQPSPAQPARGVRAGIRAFLGGAGDSGAAFILPGV